MLHNTQNQLALQFGTHNQPDLEARHSMELEARRSTRQEQYFMHNHEILQHQDQIWNNPGGL